MIIFSVKAPAAAVMLHVVHLEAVSFARSREFGLHCADALTLLVPVKNAFHLCTHFT